MSTRTARAVAIHGADKCREAYRLWHKMHPASLTQIGITLDLDVMQVADCVDAGRELIVIDQDRIVEAARACEWFHRASQMPTGSDGADLRAADRHSARLYSEEAFKLAAPWGRT